MSKPKNQAEIVERFMMENDIVSGETVEKIRFPNISHIFESPPADAQVITEKVMIQGLDKVFTKSIAELVSLLVTPFQYYAGLTGISWTRGDKFMTISYVKEGFKQKGLDNDEFIDDLKDILAIMIKSRYDVRSLTWNLGEYFVELEHSPRAS